MKIFFTLILFFSFTLANNAFCQQISYQAENESRTLAEKLNLNEGKYIKIKKFNLERMEKIAALSQLREQDNRYLDLRLDQIEEEYNAHMFNTLNAKQYKAFIAYKQQQPYTYAGLTMKYNLVAQTKE